MHTAKKYCTYLTRFLKSLSVGAVYDINLKQNGFFLAHAAGSQCMSEYNWNVTSLLYLMHLSSTHQHICVFKVISPVRPDLPLASDVPNVKFKTLRLNTLNVESLEKTQNTSGLHYSREAATPTHPFCILSVLLQQQVVCIGHCSPYLCGSYVADVLRCQLFEKSSLSAVVQTQQQYPNLLVWCAL